MYTSPFGATERPRGWLNSPAPPWPLSVLTSYVAAAALCVVTVKSESERNAAENTAVNL